MGETYRIILDTPERKGMSTGTAGITKEGALIIWGAYEKLYGKHGQSMDKRESRGGICWLSEIDFWKGQQALDQDFNWEEHKI